MMLEAEIPYSKGSSALSKNAGTSAEEVEEDGEED